MWAKVIAVMLAWVALPGLADGVAPFPEAAPTSDDYVCPDFRPPSAPPPPPPAPNPQGGLSAVALWVSGTLGPWASALSTWAAVRAENFIGCVLSYA